MAALVHPRLDGREVHLALFQPLLRDEFDVLGGTEAGLDADVAQVLAPEIGILDVSHQVEAMEGAGFILFDHPADEGAHQIKGSHLVPLVVAVGTQGTRLLGRGQLRLDAPRGGAEDGLQHPFEVEGGPAVRGDDQLGCLQVELAESLGQGVEARRRIRGDAELEGARMLLAGEQVHVGRPRRRCKFLVRVG